MSGGNRLALFDLDGTLVDSAPDLAHAVDYALSTHGFAPIGEAQLRDYIGGGATRLIHRALTGRPDGNAPSAIFERVYETFDAVYAASVFVRSRVYPTTTETLESLRSNGWKLAVVTNKPARFSEPLLTAADLADRFDLVLSGDSLPAKKPEPAPLLHAMSLLDSSVDRTVMVGDSLLDLGAGRRAGCRVVCVNYGYGGGVDLAAAGADRCIDRLAELGPWCADCIA